MFDILHKNAPEFSVGVFERDEPEYETRSSSSIRKLIKRSTTSAFSIRRVLPSIWESLPYDIVQETDRPTFRGLLRENCFGIYDL